MPGVNPAARGGVIRETLGALADGIEREAKLG
jgi:hypothetical protein